MPDIEAARRTCDAVVAAINRAERAHVPVEREVHVRAAMAAVSRCRAMLIGVVALDRAGRADVVGVILRAMLEAWYFGVIVLLGDEDDFERLEADNRYWKNDFAKGRPGIVQDPGPAATFSVRKRAMRASELMGLVVEDPDAPLTWYREMYAGESLKNAHASPSSLGDYLFVDDEGVVGIDLDPELDEGLRFGRLLLGAGLTAMLARWTFERADIETTELNSVDFDLDD